MTHQVEHFELFLVGELHLPFLVKQSVVLLLAGIELDLELVRHILDALLVPRVFLPELVPDDVGIK